MSHRGITVGENDWRRIRFGASPKQLSRLRNGHKVRIKQHVSGKGFQMVVKPEKYNTISRAFGRGKGVEIALSPEEILGNQQSTPEMEGEGIFQDVGKVLKKGAKLLKKPLSDVADFVLDKGAEYAGPALGAVLAAGATAVGQPQLIPGALMIGNEAGKALGNMGKKALKKEKNKLIEKHLGDRPKSANNVGTTNVPARSGYNNSLQGQEMYDRSLGQLNDLTGSNMGYMGRAGLANMNYIQLQALADQARQEQMNRPTSIDAAGGHSFNSNMIGNRGSYRWVGGAGEGLYAGKQGRGMYSGSGFRASGGQVGARGQAVLPPALQSQPYAANFQFQHTLPPQYQHLHRGH